MGKHYRKLGAALALVVAATFLASAEAVAVSDNDGRGRAPQKHALVVGVSEYVNLPERFRLLGPANDAALVSRMLLRAGFSGPNVVVLSDGRSGTDLPTRAAILQALDDILDRTQSGDFVFLHFSGHGSQQPAARPRPGSGALLETDGFDEIFLPRDVGHWDGSTGFVKNAIVDNELGDYITRLRNQGVFVWAVFDACHAGTLLRSAPAAGERDRRVEFMDLVRPDDAEVARAEYERVAPARPISQGRMPRTIEAPATLADNAAGFVAFYAAQTFEATPELRLPVGETPREPLGLFTFALSRVVESNPGITYRQAAQQVMLAYDAMGRRRPTPLFEGTALDAPIFASETELRIEQWPLIADGDDTYVQAGSLQELGVGSVLAVVPEPASPDGAALGYIEVIDSELVRSRVEIAAESDAFELPPRAYARLVRREVSLNLQVAAPTYDGAAPESADRARRALDRLAADENANALISWVEAGEPADLRLVVSDGSIWLVPPRGELVKTGPDATPSIGLDLGSEKLMDAIRDSLHRVAKATNLLKLARTSHDAFGSLALTMSARRAGDAEFTPIKEATRQSFADGDLLKFEMYNVSRTPIDVTMLFVDSRWGITPVYPLQSGVSNRIESGGRDVVEGTVNSTGTIGIERVLVIAVPADRDVARADFSFLAQSTLPVLRSGVGRTDLHELLARAGFHGGRSRGFDRRETAGATLQVLSWETR